jgi:hypothetical protein
MNWGFLNVSASLIKALIGGSNYSELINNAQPHGLVGLFECNINMPFNSQAINISGLCFYLTFFKI